MVKITEIISGTDEDQDIENQGLGEDETPEPEEDGVDDQEPEPDEAQAEDDDTDDDEDVVTIGDEKSDEPADTAPAWVRDLRKKHRQMKQRNRELEQQLQQYQAPAVHEPGPKPTLEGCDYDSDQYEQKLSDWYETKRKAEEAKAERKAKEEQQLKAYQEKIAAYQEKKKTLKVRDYEDAESLVEDTLSIAQQNIIIEGADNPALLVYALGKNPEKAKKLAEIKNHVRFAFEVAKLEKELKVSKRKPKTQPEKTIKGTGTLSGTTDRTLDRLREEAARTGDMSKVMAYRRKKKAAAG
jgi:hypothetical protein